MNGISRTKTSTRLAVFFSLSACAYLPLSCAAGDLSVRVTGMSEPYGTVGCSLFSGKEGFPMNNSKAKSEWVPAVSDSVTCRFKDISPGKYAVSVAHDINGNRKVDTNLFGIPTEQWGVSNNVRPTLRAPRFEEALFNVPVEVPSYVIDIKVAK